MPNSSIVILCITLVLQKLFNCSAGFFIHRLLGNTVCRSASIHLSHQVCVCGRVCVFVFYSRSVCFIKRTTTAKLAIVVKHTTAVLKANHLVRLTVHTWSCMCMQCVCVQCSIYGLRMCDICRDMCVHLWLLRDLVRSVCKCGSGRPLACHYVLMLHIWFPNFPPSVPGRNPPPSSTHVRTLFCFFRGLEGRGGRFRG